MNEHPFRKKKSFFEKERKQFHGSMNSEETEHFRNEITE